MLLAAAPEGAVCHCSAQCQGFAGESPIARHLLDATEIKLRIYLEKRKVQQLQSMFISLRTAS